MRWLSHVTQEQEIENGIKKENEKNFFLHSTSAGIKKAVNLNMLAAR